MSNINLIKQSEPEKRIDAWLKGYDKGFREGRIAQSKIDKTEFSTTTWVSGYWKGYEVGMKKENKKEALAILRKAQEK